jgi:hypothetical protein
MNVLTVHAHANRRLHASRFKWPQISRSLEFAILICAISLFCGGLLAASDPGQLAWKEQRGTMKSAEIGVVVWKEQPFHNDKTARAFAFDSMKRSGLITWFYNGTVNKSFEPHTFVQHIRFPQWPPGEIVAQEDFDSLKFKLGELESFANKYPNAAGYLEGMIGSMREAVSKFSAGNVFFNGAWVTRSEHAKLVSQRNEAISKNVAERELYQKHLYQVAQEAMKAQQEAKKTSLWILASSGVWLLLLLLAMLIRSWVTVSFLVIVLLVVAGWFTYTESGFGWIENVVLAVEYLPSLLPFLKE